MHRRFTARLVTLVALATLPLLAACSMMNMSGSDTKTPAQTSQNPARQMHYSQSAAQKQQ
jgi:hypothetical protein